jgi:hypothetical protein
MAGSHGAGTHVCLIYDNETERREVVAAFARDGLASGERVAYFTDAQPADIHAWLTERGVDLPEPPQFTVDPAGDVYFPDGEFVPERMPPFWHRFHEEATAGGFPAARATGETSWSRDVRGGERIVEYEARLNDVLAEIPVTALCQYDVHRFDGATILDILRVHPLMLIGGQMVRNPYYMTPHQFLTRRSAADE